jgi:polysaccharide biosynthesis protein PslH
VSRLSILAVTSEPPWPLDTGGHLRSYYLLAALAAKFDMRLVTGSSAPPSLDRLEAAGIRTTCVTLPPHSFARDAAVALGAAAQRQPYVMYSRHKHEAIRQALLAEAAAQPPDVLYLDHLDSWLYADVAPGAARIVDLHNVYSLLAGRTGTDTGGVKGVYLGHESRLLARIEQECAAHADALMTVSADEQRHFMALGAKAVHVVPNGVNCPGFTSLPTGRTAGPPTLLYLGTMSWTPNASAARFLAEQVLPEVRRTIPDARLRLVGRDPLPEVKALASLPGVEVTGGVPDVMPHLLDAHVLAVPLESGGGTRLKILEAFAAGLPVLSTRVGAEGIAAAHDTHLLIAERPAFAQAAVGLLSDANVGVRLATAARQLAAERYDWTVVGALAAEAVSALPIKRSYSRA